MRFLSIYKTVERDEPPTEEEMARMGALIEEWPRRGKLISVEGCLPSALGARVRRDGASITVTDGPFTEAKELVGGFQIIEAADYEEAIKIASLHPAARMGEELGWGIELRAMGVCELQEIAKRK